IPRDRVAWFGAETLRRIQTGPLTDQQRFLLGECVQAYLPLDAAQPLECLVAREQFKGVQTMNVTWYEKGIENGIETGMEKERRESVRELLEEQYGLCRRRC